jgi:hypothetical protein
MCARHHGMLRALVSCLWAVQLCYPVADSALLDTGHPGARLRAPRRGVRAVVLDAGAVRQLCQAEDLSAGPRLNCDRAHHQPHQRVSACWVPKLHQMQFQLRPVT